MKRAIVRSCGLAPIGVSVLVSHDDVASSLEALPVHDGRAGLIVLLLADPHLLEGGQ